MKRTLVCCCCYCYCCWIVFCFRVGSALCLGCSIVNIKFVYPLLVICGTKLMRGCNGHCPVIDETRHIMSTQMAFVLPRFDVSPQP